MESIVLAIIWAVVSLVVTALRKSQEASAEVELPAPTSPGYGGIPDFRPPEVMDQDLDRLEKQRKGLLTEIQQGPGLNRVLVDVLEERVGPSIESAREDLAAEEGQLATARYEETRRHMAVLSRLAQIRAEGDRGAHLADAETLAEALMKPFTHLSNTEQFRFARHRPVAVPAAPDEESIWYGLLPDGFPVIFVPPDFGQNMFRWASLPHELGHLIWRAVPGFEEEARQRLGLSGQGYLLRIDGEGGVNIFEPFSAWLEEMVADAFAVMMMGPAGLRGLIECFASPGNPDSVLWAGSDGLRFAPHPPAHLRVIMAGRLLHHIGFDVEVEPLIEDWKERHEHPEQVYLPTMTGQALGVEVEALANIGTRLLQGFHDGAYASLTGRELRSIHGLELSPGEWARAQRHIPELISGHALRSDPKSLLIGGIEAFAQNPAAKENIRRAVGASVLGRDADERRPEDSAYSISKPKKGSSGSLAKDVRAAIVLHEVLRPRFRARM